MRNKKYTSNKPAADIKAVLRASSMEAAAVIPAITRVATIATGSAMLSRILFFTFSPK